MQTTISAKDRATATVPASYTTGSVTSQDGATIGYRQLGHDPGVVLLHGDLKKVLPHARRVDFPGLDHAVAVNADRGGKPEPVAQALRGFFA